MQAGTPGPSGHSNIRQAPGPLVRGLGQGSRPLSQPACTARTPLETRGTGHSRAWLSKGVDLREAKPAPTEERCLSLHGGEPNGSRDTLALVFTGVRESEP